MTLYFCHGGDDRGMLYGLDFGTYDNGMVELRSVFDNHGPRHTHGAGIVRVGRRTWPAKWVCGPNLAWDGLSMKPKDALALINHVLQHKTRGMYTFACEAGPSDLFDATNKHRKLRGSDLMSLFMTPEELSTRKAARAAASGVRADA